MTHVPEGDANRADRHIELSNHLFQRRIDHLAELRDDPQKYYIAAKSLLEGGASRDIIDETIYEQGRAVYDHDHHRRLAS